MDVPGEVLDRLIEFLESTADSVNLTSLVQVWHVIQILKIHISNAKLAAIFDSGRTFYSVQIIIDHLSDDYSDCTTAALLNHTGFNNFIHDCARLAWKMILITPPLVISTDKGY